MPQKNISSNANKNPKILVVCYNFVQPERNTSVKMLYIDTLAARTLSRLYLTDLV